MANEIWRRWLARAAVMAACGVLAVPAAARGPSSYGPVGNETLWSIARKVSQDRSGSTAQIAWALYRANPAAFDGPPSRLRPGATLRIPDNGFINAVPAAQAYAYLTGAATPPEAATTPVAAAAAPAAAPAAAAAATPAGAFAGSSDQATAQEMERAGQSADAVYRFLEPREEVYAGDVDFDYLLGTRALDSGRYSQAIFVLQRAVATRPGFAGARMELARAYYAQGDNESARREFQTLREEDPPPEARRAIAEYLAAIDRRASVYESQLGGYAELGTGFDTNANGAPDTQSFLGFQLDSRNQSTSSSYYALGLGGLVSHPFAPGWRLLGTGNAAYRGNPDATFVDSQVLRLSGGVEWRPNQWEFSLQPNFAMAMLDGEDNHDVVGVDAAATRHFEDARFSLNVRSGQTRFADGLETLDVDTRAYGLAAQWPVPGRLRLQLVSALTRGSDDAVEAGSPFGRDFTGARGAAIVDFGGGHAVMISVASLTADYDGAFFGMTREDSQVSGGLSYEWGGLRAIGWTLRGQLNYVDNSSTVALYDYDRIDAGLSLRKEFK